MELPKSTAEVVVLIQDFYSGPSNSLDPQRHSQIDKILISLQKSPQGFQLADELLGAEDKGVRYFGASTFHAKIEDGIRSFTDEEKQELLNRLVSWLVTACDKNYDHNVITKLAACLVLYFYRTEAQWRYCILYILVSLVQGEPHRIDPPSDYELLKEAVWKLSSSKRHALYEFLDVLAQEIQHSPQSDTPIFKERILENLPLIATLVGFATENASSIEDDCVWAAAKSLPHIAAWAKQNLDDPNVAWNLLRPAMTSLINALLENVDIMETISNALDDLLNECPAFLLPEHHVVIESVLLSPQSDKWISDLESGDFGLESEHIAKFLLMYCTLRAEQIIEHPQNGKELFSRVLRITSRPAVAIVDDEFATTAVEFWQSLCETLSMAQFASDGQLGPETWLQWYDGILPRMAHTMIEKARLPNADQMKKWSEDTRSKYSQFRLDVSALMGALCELLGPPLVEHIVSFIWLSKAQQDWTGVESGLNCLNYLIEWTDTDDDENRMLPALLDSDRSDSPALIVYLNEGNVSTPLLKRALVFIETYGKTISLRSDHLPQVLTFLSRCLRVSNTLAVAAAKALALLCWVGRVKMGSILGDLLNLYEGYFGEAAKRDPTVQEKLAGAVAAVIQATGLSTVSVNDWQNSDALAALDRLLATVETDLQRAVQLLEAGTADKAKEVNQCALNCLKSIGNGFREPAVAVVDLDEDEVPPAVNIWNHTPDLLQGLQQRILRASSESLRSFNGPDEIEAFCRILRAGYTESQPNPFVFDLSATEGFVLSCSLSTSRIGMVLETAAVLLNKHKGRTAEVKSFALTCMKHVRSMIEPFFHRIHHLFRSERENAEIFLGNPSEDPEVASIVVDFSLEFIPDYLNCLLNSDEPEDLRSTFDFLLACLASHEIMPKRSASKFWATFARSARSGQAGLIEACLAEYSMSLASMLVAEIGGGASRSELDYLCEPLKALVFRGGLFLVNFRQAMKQLSIRNDHISPSEKNTAAEQIIKLRGGPKTNKIVKDFWAACRGTFTMK